jgi:hypothetical protein
MPTSVSQLTQIISRASGVPLARCKQVARKLLEDGHLPLSSGSYVASVGNIDAVKLLLATLASVETKDTSRAMQSLFDLRAADSNRTLGHQVYELLAGISVLDEGTETALDGLIEVDAETPRVVIKLNVSGEAVESVFASEGAASTSPETARRVTVLRTRALATIAIALGRNTRKAA